VKKIAVIPARYAASRFPGKLMQLLGNKPVIRHTYDNTMATNLFDEVWVATDSEIIFNEIKTHGGKVVMSTRFHESGSDRIAEAIENMDAEIIVNVQGDEPFVQRNALEKLLQVFDHNNVEKVQVASLMQLMQDQENIDDPNYVKVAIDKNWNALFFSRSVIPYPRSRETNINYYEHILMSFTKWEQTPLEMAEKIECLRYLENGISMKMVLVDYMGVEIDTPEDLIKAANFISGT